MKSLKSTAAAAVAAGLMAVSAIAPAGVAFAASPSAGAQTGTGATDVTVQLKGGEYGGTEDPNNPDGDDDGFGDNIAFSVPASINFIADAEGKLTGPSADAAYIENASVFAIHASSFKTDTANGWSIIADGSEATADNSIDFQFGPSSDKAKNADAADFTAKAGIAEKCGAENAAQWNMEAAAATGTADRVQLNTSGDIFNVKADLTQQTKVAEIHTYVTAGTV